MRSSLLYFLPLALLLGACPGQTKEDDPAPAKACLLTKETKMLTYNGTDYPAYSSRITYDSRYQPTSVTQDSAGVEKDVATLSYNSNKQLAQVTNTKTQLTYEYNNQNQLVKQTRFIKNPETGAFEKQDFYTFSYSASNNLAVAQYFYTGMGTESLYYTYKYTYTNGDPIKIEHLDAQQNRLLLANITYDDKPSPYLVQLLGFFEPVQAPARHNLVQYTATDRNNGITSYTASYIYNEDGFPVTAVKQYLSGYKELTAYTYNCP